MSAAENISFSRETLRAELAALELRIVDRLTAALEHKADKAALDAALREIDSLKLLAAGRTHLPESVNDHERRLTALERFRWAVPSTAVISTLVALGITAQQIFS